MIIATPVFPNPLRPSSIAHATVSLQEDSNLKIAEKFPIFEEVWKVVKDSFYDQTYNNHNWNDIHTEFITQLASGEMNEKNAIQKMLLLLNDRYSRLLDIKTYNDNSKELGYKKVYVCCKNDDAYKDRLCRLKPFLLSLSRCNIINLILENKEIEKSIIRIHTDNITLSQEFDFKKAGYTYYPIKEEKTSGRIYWKSSNTYFHICDKCNTKYKYDKNIIHIC
jgi:hypothetical protein